MHTDEHRLGGELGLGGRAGSCLVKGLRGTYRVRGWALGAVVSASRLHRVGRGFESLSAQSSLREEAPNPKCGFRAHFRCLMFGASLGPGAWTLGAFSAEIGIWNFNSFIFFFPPRLMFLTSRR